MIQFNLLPDVKVEYIKVSRTKHLVITSSLVASGVMLLVLLLLILTVDVFQKKNINDLTADIKTDSTQLSKVPDLNKILTIQSQLSTLTTLHDQKVVASRFLPYIQKITPSNVSLSGLNADFVQHQITFTGQSDSLDNVNKFTDTLKFTTYSTSDHSVDNKQAFSNVVLSTFSRSQKSASFSITLTFDPAIFNSQSDVTITVPPIVSTRSITDQPTGITGGTANTQ